MIGAILLFTVMALVASKFRFGSFFAPLGAFAGVWGISLLLLTLTTLSGSPMMGTTWLIIITGWVSFVGSSLIVPRSNTARDKAGTRKVGMPGQSQLSRLMVWFALASMVGAIRFAAIIVNRMGWSRYISDPLSIRYALTVGSVPTGHLTVVFLGVTMAAAALGGISAAHNPRYWPSYVPVVSAAIFDAVCLGRAHTIVVGCVFISSWLLSRGVQPGPQRLSLHMIGRRRRRALLWVAGLGILVSVPFGLVSSARLGGLQDADTVIRSYTTNLSQNWYLVDSLVEVGETESRGVNTLLPLYLLLYRCGLRSTDPRSEILFSTSRATGTGETSNTYTVLGGAYADFGLTGVVIILCAAGLLSGLLFRSYRMKPRLWHVVALGFVYAWVLFTVQGDQTASPQFTLGCLLGIGTAVFLERCKLWREPVTRSRHQTGRFSFRPLPETGSKA
jgi:oligosaccharide repeat unit polymerase